MMPEKIRVLYVDDESALLDLGKMFLERSGDFTVTTATGAPDAIRVLEKEKFDVIISDYQMPGMDGIEFLVLVRTKFGQIPFILFTGKGREEVVIQAINSGADFYLQKGGDPSAQFAELSHKIKSAASRKRAVDSLRESEERLRNITATVPGAVYQFSARKDGSMGMNYISEQAEKIIGAKIDRESFVERFIAMVVPEQRESFVESIKKATSAVSEWKFEWIMKKPAGELIWLSAHSIPVVTGDEVIFSGIFQDITERKQSEAALRESEEKFREIFNNATDAIHICEVNDDSSPGKFIEVNAVSLWMHGYSKEEMLTKTPFELTTGKFNPPIEKIIEQQRTTGTSMFETEHRRKDGSIVPVELTSHIITILGKKVLLGVAHDITERKKAEETLRESEGRFRTLFEQSKDAVFIADPKTRMITDCNRKAELLTGYSRAELITLKVDDLHPEDVRAETVDNFKRYADGMDASVESVVITRDGQRVHVSILGNFIVVNNQDLLIASFRDISRRKQAADLLALTASKLALMNDVTYQYIQNKVTGLRGYAELSKDAKTDAERLYFIEKEEQVLADIHHLIKDTRDYQEIGSLESQWISVERSIRVASSLVSPGQGISVETALHGLELYSDPLLEKIFSNLIENAVLHGRITTRITFSSKETPEGLILICEDDGAGISPVIKASLFDRRVGQSIRFGLFFVHECLNLSGMTIAETGEPGKGARFEITVPKGAYRFDSNQKK